MLGKLLKHELRATVRVMLPLIGVLLCLSVLANLSFRSFDADTTSAFAHTLNTIVIILFAVGMLAVCVMSVVLMVQRFRGNLLQDEGYIMFTLPVSVHELIWSKIIVSALWFAATFLALMASGFISIWRVEYTNDFFRLIKMLIEEFNAKLALNFTAVALEVLALAFMGCTAFAVTFYAALATGHGFQSKKMLLSVVSFIVFVVASELVSSSIINLFNAFDISLPFYNTAATTMAQWHIGCAYAALFIAVYIVIFYLITAVSLKRRLNLD